MLRRIQILEQLADGRFHSGEDLANGLGISRAAVWKQIRILEDMGIDVRAIPGKGYCLPGKFEFLDRGRILAGLDTQWRIEEGNLELLSETDSTNERLLDYLPERSIHRHICLAEYQNAGRGRRGNDWIMPFGSGACMSVGWHFEMSPDSITAL